MSDAAASANVRALKDGYDAVARGDFDAANELLGPDAVMYDRPEVPDPGVYTGPDGATQALQATYDYFDDVALVPERFHERGEFIVVEITLRGRGKGSGVPVEQRLAHLWELRDGRPVRMQAYTHVDDALRDAGMPPL